MEAPGLGFTAKCRGGVAMICHLQVFSELFKPFIAVSVVLSILVVRVRLGLERVCRGSLISL
jgi:multisubunit Na+/H+ antiporter MnhB subunit